MNFKGGYLFKRIRCLIRLNTAISNFFLNTLENSINRHATSVHWQNDTCALESWKWSCIFLSKIVTIFIILIWLFCWTYTSNISTFFNSHHSFQQSYSKSITANIKINLGPYLFGRTSITWPSSFSSATSYYHSSANFGPHISLLTPIIFQYFNIKCHTNSK